MAKHYALIVFDWDGTLMDSTALIVDSVQAAARDLGLTPPTPERARHIIGLGLTEALSYALPELTPAQQPELSARYRHHYLSRDATLQLFPGARELIKALAAAGHSLAVATGKSRAGLDRSLATSGLLPHFHATRCADECHSKPHPQMLEELMAECGAAAADTLMIGDTTHDVQMAHNAGVVALAVSHGAHPSAALHAARPLHCARDLIEARAWLRV